MDEKSICYRCRSEIYRHQGTAYYGYYIAHKSPDDCTAYLNRKIQELEARLVEQEWRSVTDDAPEAYVTVELLVTGYRDEFGIWWYPDGAAPIRGWRPPAATE